MVDIIVPSSSDHYCPILGYNSDSTAYAPNHVIKATSAPAISTIPITYLAKADNVKESGEYSTSLTYTAITNYVTTPIANGMFMQDIDTKVCNDTPLYSESNTIYTVKDIRDRTEYTVAKLADGNCWMTQNLELGEYGKPITLTSMDSNVSSDGYTLEFQFPNNSVYKGNNNHYGNYYTWDQATAGSGNNIPNYTNAPYSICPKNWRLHRDNSDVTKTEPYKMLKDYITTGSWVENTTIAGSGPGWENVNMSQITGNPVSLVLSGDITNTGAIHLQEQRGFWWSATNGGGSYARYFRIYYTGVVNPQAANAQTYGFSIRCLTPSS